MLASFCQFSTMNFFNVISVLKNSCSQGMYALVDFTPVSRFEKFRYLKLNWAGRGIAANPDNVFRKGNFNPKIFPENEQVKIIGSSFN